MKDRLINAWDWIKRDWNGHPFRFALEVACWFNSMACSIIINSTVPDPPWMLLYPMYISGLLAYTWCSWSRGSFGMLATFSMLACLDIWGFSRILSGQ